MSDKDDLKSIEELLNIVESRYYNTAVQKTPAWFGLFEKLISVTDELRGHISRIEAKIDKENESNTKSA